MFASVGVLLVGCKSSGTRDAIAYGAAAAAIAVAQAAATPAPADPASEGEGTSHGEPRRCTTCGPTEHLGRDYGRMDHLAYWVPCSEDGTCDRERVYEYADLVASVHAVQPTPGPDGQTAVWPPDMVVISVLPGRP